MEITFFIIVSFVIYLFHLMIRNDRVYMFQKELNHLGAKVCRDYLNSINAEDYDEEKRAKHDKLVEMWNQITDISYAKMLFSLKPLTIGKWLTPEQIEFLASDFSKK